MLEFRDEVSKLLGLKNGISQQDLSILLKFLAWNKKTIAFDERVRHLLLLVLMLLSAYIDRLSSCNPLMGRRLE